MKRDDERDETHDEDINEPGGESHGESGEGEFVAERKKSINPNTLVIIAIIAGVVGATYLMVLKTAPKPVDATLNPQADAAGQTISAFLSNGRENIRTMEVMLNQTQKVVEQFKSDTSARQVPMADLQTNPFHFARVQAPTVDLDQEAAKRKKQEDRDAAIAAARLIHLQSVLIGSARRSCVIDGKVYSEGQAMGQFIILSIKPKSIIVSTAGFKLEVPMQSPGQL